jgi:hypothetical protein
MITAGRCVLTAPLLSNNPKSKILRNPRPAGEASVKMTILLEGAILVLNICKQTYALRVRGL